MHSERRWDLGSKRRIRHLRLRGNGPAWVPLFLTLAALIVLLYVVFLAAPSSGR